MTTRRVRRHPRRRPQLSELSAEQQALREQLWAKLPVTNWLPPTCAPVQPAPIPVVRPTPEWYFTIQLVGTVTSVALALKAKDLRRYTCRDTASKRKDKELVALLCDFAKDQIDTALKRVPTPVVPGAL